ncbi:MAG: SAM-dependent chlorinase/fluorinase [Cyanobacteria bacterium J06639_1]
MQPIATQASCLTLLTDFGDRDVYVGAMKGAIACVNPSLSVIDLTHHIPPQDVATASFQLATAYRYFPPGTVHVAVVDPGVGTARRAIAIAISEGILVGPDNGLFSDVLNRSPAIAAVELDNPDFWRDRSASPTFHGRDIFAPVGAHLASGVVLAQVGSAIVLPTLQRLPELPRERTEWGWLGSIQAIDRFGNLITNLAGTLVTSEKWEVAIGDRCVPGCMTYGDRPSGEFLALAGSDGWIEIAVNGGSARDRLQAKRGDRVELRDSRSS